MKTTAVLPDLLTATLAVSLWFAPKDLAIAGTNVGRLMRSTGYASSMVFYAKAYLSLFFNYSKFQLAEQREALREDIALELEEFKQEQRLHIEKAKIEHQAMQELQPIFISMRSLEEESEPESNVAELSEEEKQKAAKNAIEQALSPTVIQSKYSEEEIRQHFPESGDSTCWSAICKALGSGYSKQEIVSQVLNCNGTNQAIGEAYFDLLKSRYM